MAVAGWNNGFAQMADIPPRCARAGQIDIKSEYPLSTKAAAGDVRIGRSERIAPVRQVLAWVRTFLPRSVTRVRPSR